MNGHKETRPDVAASERAVENGSVHEMAHDSTTKDITPAPRGQTLHIADLLSHGAENGVTITDLERLTDLDNRTIRLMIQGERLHGVPILSDCRSGYYLPENELERAQCVRSLLRRAKEIERVARAIEGAAGLD